MELYIGGAWQGKSACAQKRHPQIEWIRGSACTWEELCRAEGILGLQEYIARALDEGTLPKNFAEKLFQANPELVIVCREVGSGVVPLSHKERIFRETTGRICTQLAARCSLVVRVTCGLEMILKMI
ncbi:MAG: bifunctional adenosylcobinamide kinase/adenosylcobinamide-phosphate guanylyltransferase [Blautia sp.]|nr:bifunctional adenosylcobinamide kinase/adenosylcobinamide-phosphate guanylyltransferase [Blautia sp.]